MFNVNDDALEVFDDAAHFAEIEAYRAALSVRACHWNAERIKERRFNEEGFDSLGKRGERADQALKDAIARAVLAVQNARVLRDVANTLWDTLE